MSQGAFGNLCDTNNFGDPVVLYDTFEDRWIITDFAFTLDGSNNVINPPGSFQCFAASKTGDPVSGGWNFYSINTSGGLGDYPKLGIWPDGLYMSVNMFGYSAGASSLGPRVYAFNRAQMYAVRRASSLFRSMLRWLTSRSCPATRSYRPAHHPPARPTTSYRLGSSRTRSLYTNFTSTGTGSLCLRLPDRTPHCGDQLAQFGCGQRAVTRRQQP
jgi:hypothetical protein